MKAYRLGVHVLKCTLPRQRLHRFYADTSRANLSKNSEAMTVLLYFEAVRNRWTESAELLAHCLLSHTPVDTRELDTV